MPEEELKKMTKPNEAQRKILESVHKTLLEALRHREQEILRYIAILAPALARLLPFYIITLPDSGSPAVSSLIWAIVF